MPLVSCEVKDIISTALMYDELFWSGVTPEARRYEPFCDAGLENAATWLEASLGIRLGTQVRQETLKPSFSYLNHD